MKINIYVDTHLVKDDLWKLAGLSWDEKMGELPLRQSRKYIRPAVWNIKYLVNYIREIQQFNSKANQSKSKLMLDGIQIKHIYFQKMIYICFQIGCYFNDTDHSITSTKLFFLRKDDFVISILPLTIKCYIIFIRKLHCRYTDIHINVIQTNIQHWQNNLW